MRRSVKTTDQWQCPAVTRVVCDQWPVWLGDMPALLSLVTVTSSDKKKTTILLLCTLIRGVSLTLFSQPLLIGISQKCQTPIEFFRWNISLKGWYQWFVYITKKFHQWFLDIWICFSLSLCSCSWESTRKLPPEQ